MQAINTEPVILHLLHNYTTFNIYDQLTDVSDYAGLVQSSG